MQPFIYYLITTFWILLISLFGYSLPAHAEINITSQAPKQDLPIEVRLTLHINKIYDIRPVDESYSIDAYLTADWIDPRARTLVPETEEKIVLEDNLVDDIRDELWSPSFEVINITGPKESSNKRIFIHKNGKVVYTERFKAVMHSEMNFRKFPFDSQELKVTIEPFAYASSKMTFSDKSKVFPTESNAWPMTEWTVTSRTCEVNDSQYDFLVDITGERYFPQFEFSVQIQRIPDYFIYQIIVPLIIIMLCAWSVHFINDSATQLSLISTLMLTVYAFNFFIADSIPKLPYNTFLGKLIVISFSAIFLQLICHIIQLNTKREFTAKQNSIVVILFLFGFGVASAVSWNFSSQPVPQDQPLSQKSNIRQCG
ncbi:MAG: Cys-loop ligand-gated ionic channel [Cellvibrio sp.]|nr:Cys-loop ligand-gated ionic channel [Cellvibrio sp.]